MSTHKKKFRVLLVIFLLIVAGTLGEIFLQVQQYLKVRLITHRRYGFFEVDPFLQIRPKRYPQFDRDLHVNADSFRGDPVSDDPDTYRIFVLGGSTSYSYTLPYEQTYPAKLQKKLRQEYPYRKIQVENAACDWYSTEHSIIRYLFYVRYYKPQLVIIMHAVNDLFRSFAPEWWCRPGDTFRRDYSHYLGPVVGLERTRVKYFPFTEFLLYKKIKNMLFAPDPAQLAHIDGEDPDFSEKVRRLNHPAAIRQFQSLPVFEENLKRLIRLIREDNVRVLVATQPYIYNKNLSDSEKARLYFAPLHCSQNGAYPDVESMEYGMDLFNRAIVRVASELNVPLVDLEKGIPKNETYFLDDIHPSDAATEIESQLLLGEIKRLKLME
ncbi:MAG TPA: SGNH/GDSL hydrolase family protein [Patescibacteria group bacterium]|nr:SGNH/GDSL hydrolase family protein [Patescibacteria group bacterium]